jgi:hypothetical protein
MVALSQIGCDVSSMVKQVLLHFHELPDPSNDLAAVPLSIVYDIISHPSLMVASEDSFFNT